MVPSFRAISVSLEFPRSTILRGVRELIDWIDVRYNRACIGGSSDLNGAIAP